MSKPIWTSLVLLGLFISNSIEVRIGWEPTSLLTLLVESINPHPLAPSDEGNISSFCAGFIAVCVAVDIGFPTH